MQTGPGQAARAFERMLQRLDTEYLDCLLIHWPATSGLTLSSPKHRQNRAATWRHMQDLYQQQRCSRMRVCVCVCVCGGGGGGGRVGGWGGSRALIVPEVCMLPHQPCRACTSSRGLHVVIRSVEMQGHGAQAPAWSLCLLPQKDGRRPA